MLVAAEALYNQRPECCIMTVQVQGGWLKGFTFKKLQLHMFPFASLSNNSKAQACNQEQQDNFHADNRVVVDCRVTQAETHYIGPDLYAHMVFFPNELYLLLSKH